MNGRVEDAHLYYRGEQKATWSSASCQVCLRGRCSSQSSNTNFNTLETLQEALRCRPLQEFCGEANYMYGCPLLTFNSALSNFNGFTFHSHYCMQSRLDIDKVKALVWFWWIDETLSANLVYLSDHEIGSTIQVVEQWWRSWWWCGDHDGQVLGLEKKKEKNKNLKAKVISIWAFFVWWSGHLASVITFRIDSHIIKRGETRIEIRLSKWH